MSNEIRVSQRVESIPKSAIHEMTRLSKEIEDVAFLSWAKPTARAPSHIGKGVSRAIEAGLTDGYSESSGLVKLREKITEKLKRDNNI